MNELGKWQSRYETAKTAYSVQLAQMDEREKYYKGNHDIRPVVEGDDAEDLKRTPHVRNICAELIEAQVSSEIPPPKVTALHKEDEPLAKIIEDMLRNELDRLPFELMNDQDERTTPIQGGDGFFVEWDNSKRTHTTVGELAVSLQHPKRIIPQPGITSGIEDMDYIFLDFPQSKQLVERRYGVIVEDEADADPELTDGKEAEDMITHHFAYYRNDRGGIGLYSWVGDTEVQNLEDYQARILRRCKKCGALEPLEAEPIDEPVHPDGTAPEGVETTAVEITDEETQEKKRPRLMRGSRKRCPFCGAAEWEESREEFEEVWKGFETEMGNFIPGAQTVVTPTGQLDAFGTEILSTTETPERIPFYKPDIYPIILRKNVSLHGSFLGDSDIDKIEDQQNSTNRMEAKVLQKLVKSGSYMTAPKDSFIPIGAEDMKPIRIDKMEEIEQFKVLNMEGAIQQDMAYLEQIYQEARQVIGITDSFQGRKDPTATSGKAKEFAAAQSAGRLESKKRMKEAAYAALYEAMFKYKLAYTDEERPVRESDEHGDTQYHDFDRYDFLKKDAAGEWYWNTDFLFSCDSNAPLASNREAMWQETRMNLQQGAFGNPQDLNTLILFWTKMESLHYPTATETKDYLRKMLEQQEAEAAARRQAEAIVAEETAADEAAANEMNMMQP